MRERALFLLAVLVGLAGVTPAWAGGGVVIRIGPRPAPSNVIVVSPPANVIVVQPPVIVVPRPVRRSAVIFLGQPCDIPVTRVWPSPGPARAFLILDATPGDAEVFVDGRSLGSAGALVARALPISPGRHWLEIASPGFQPFSAQFIASPTFPARLRVALVPQ
jgi:hypothetical protein